MPIKTVVDDVRRRVIARCSGVVSYEDIAEHLDFEEQRRGLDYRELIDARRCSTNLTPEQIRSLVRRVHRLAQAHSDFGPTAIVADSDLVYGMARMFALVNEIPDETGPGPPIEVFRDVGEAEQWLAMHGR